MLCPDGIISLFGAKQVFFVLIDHVSSICEEMSGIQAFLESVRRDVHVLQAFFVLGFVYFQSLFEVLGGGCELKLNVLQMVKFLFEGVVLSNKTFQDGFHDLILIGLFGDMQLPNNVDLLEQGYLSLQSFPHIFLSFYFHFDLPILLLLYFHFSFH